MSRTLDGVRRDLRFTMRMLAARPGWTAAAILCLAIATGANTAAFTIVNGLLLRPLPFDEPDRLVMVALRDPTLGSPRPFSLHEYRALAESSRPTGALLARTYFPLSLAAADGARMVQTEVVSGNYFETLRVTPFLGHLFDERADRPGGTPSAVLSHRLWSLRFNANPAIVGQVVRVNGRPVVVSGVAPPDFVGATQLVAADLWLPAAMYADLAGPADVSTAGASSGGASPADPSAVPMFLVMGRLADNVTIDEAAARLSSTAAAVLTDARADASRNHAPPGVILTRATGFGVPPSVEGAVLTLSGFIYVMMALLMAVACANVAALVLARGAGRGREVAVRLSLGASRWHIARQLLTESLVLALAGCAAGTVIALWLTQALVAGLSTPFQYVSYAIDVQPDARVLAWSAIATMMAAVLCGIAPLRAAGRVDVNDVLKQSAARGRARASTRTLHAMVVLQFAVSTMLLVAAGMLVRTYVQAQMTRPGFDTSGLISAALDVSQVHVDRAAGVQLYEAVTTRLSALPGVTAIGLTRDLPLSPGRSVTVSARADAGAAGTHAPSSGGEPLRVSAAARVVSPRYFQTLGLPIRQGRGFDDREPARPRAAVINEAMASRLWPGASPLGRTFRLQDNTADDPIEVIGVVSNAADVSSSPGSNQGQVPRPAFYQPFPHEYAAGMTILIRVHTDPDRLFADVRRTVREVHADLSIVDLRTMEARLTESARQRRLPATLLTSIGLLGLLLSAVGLYGVVAYGVRERARELGIRLALGARPADVRRLVLRQGFTMVGTGLIIGAAGTAALVQVLRSTLFGLGALDPATLAAVGAVLTATGFAALYLPARWASRVEPAHTLRSE